MIIAELHGKFTPYEKREDILTSNFFGMLKYLPLAYGLLPFLKSASGFLGEGKQHFLDDLVGIKEARYFFWPYTLELKREPDLIIIMKKNSGKTVAVVVEVKYFSGKSNVDRGIWDDETNGTIEDGPDGDQLAEQFSELLNDNIRLRMPVYYNDVETINRRAIIKEGEKWLKNTGESKYLIYLTSHYALPLQEPEATITSLAKLKVPEEKYNNLLWVSWHKVDEVLEEVIIKFKEIKPKDERIEMLADACCLLKRKGLVLFKGWISLNCKDTLQLITDKYFWLEKEVYFQGIDLPSLEKKPARYFWHDF